MSETNDVQVAGSKRDRTILLAGLITYGVGQSLLYIILIPLTFPYLGVEGIKVTLRMAYTAVTGKAYGEGKATAELPAKAA